MNVVATDSASPTDPEVAAARTGHGDKEVITGQAADLVAEDSLSRPPLIIHDKDLLSCILCKKILEHPMLLQCLHNCCKECITSLLTDKQSDSNVTCPTCNIVTDAASLNDNTFIAYQASCFLRMEGGLTCTVCKEEDLIDETAEAWCVQCQNFLCEKCLKGHNRYNKSHSWVSLDIMNWAKLGPLRTRLCNKHSKTFEFICFTCDSKVPYCCTCADECIAKQHDLGLLSSPKALAYMEELKVRFCRICAKLDHHSEVLHRHIHLINDVQAARELDVDRLNSLKKYILDAVARSFKAADEELKRCYDTLDATASDLRSKAERLKQQMSFSVRYGRSVMEFGDIIDLLAQQQVLDCRLKNLDSDLGSIVAPLGAENFIVWSSRLSKDFEKAISTWIGLPILATEDLCRAISHLHLPEDEPDYKSQAAQQKELIQQLQLLVQGQQEKLLQNAVQQQQHVTVQQHVQKLKKQNARLSRQNGQLQRLQMENAELLGAMQGQYGELIYNPANCTVALQGAYTCRDLAITADGCLLVAIGARGLVEFDKNGKEKSSWIPPATTDGIFNNVFTLVSCDNGNVIAGLHYSSFLVLLSRDAVGTGWLAQKLIALQSSPWKLSLHGDLLAVNERRFGGQLGRLEFWPPSPQLVLIRLSAKATWYTRLMEYDIWSLAVTASSVVTASDCELKLVDGRESYVVDGYDHGGNRLWRHECSNKVWDVCAAPSGRGLYLAFNHSAEVTVISGDNGKNLRYVCFGNSQERFSAERLSVRNGQPPVLAVLLNDKITMHLAKT